MPAAAEEDPPEWARLIRDEVASSNRKVSAIAAQSEEAVTRFSDLDAMLKGHSFDKSTLSRMCRGKLKSPTYEKVIVLKLVLLLHSRPASSRLPPDQLQSFLDEARAFADKVMDAHRRGAQNTSLASIYDRRRAHTSELLGEYGEALLRQVRDGGEAGKPEAKLALLHSLGGNADDARYWERQASSLDSSYSQPRTRDELNSRARSYAIEYQRASHTGIARIYLELAAENGDREASRLLGHLAELHGDREEAERWYRRSGPLSPPKEEPV